MTTYLNGKFVILQVKYPEVFYPDSFEIKIGFDRIRLMLADKCICSLGNKCVEEMKMLTDYHTIETLLSQTDELRQILLRGLPFPQSNYFDPTGLFRRIKPQDTFLEPDEFLEVMASYKTILKIIEFLGRKNNAGGVEFAYLNEIFANLDTDTDLPKRINKIIDEQAYVRDSASDTLSEIRSKKKRLEIESNRKINKLLQQAKSEGLINSDVELALRNGRQVIPINAAYKRKIKGFVHDQSATGQTVYLEPEEIFEINSELIELELEERREIIKVLKALTDTIRPWLPTLEESYEKLGIIDFTRAKALVALQMLAQKPILVNGPKLKWVKAIHPLLYLSHKQQGRTVEPLSLELDEKTKVLVISGPNAGGKSVALKTCGLLQYMTQCGLLVPMESYSELGVFDNIFIDIGDQQSIENDLSTYSSHLLNMKFFVENCNEKTLFLVDELGAGTEPRIGGAIAEAILGEISNKKSYGVVTTHYANLKLMAGRYEGVVNGSMLFDTAKMRPLYRLKIGNPGSSFAFEIAKSIGLPSTLLESAEQNAGSQDIDFDRQLHDLDLKKTELDDKEKQLKAADSFLSEIVDKYEKLNSDLENRKAEIIQLARAEAKRLLADSNRVIENTIRQIKESKAERDITKQAREELAAFAKSQEEKNPISRVKPQNKKEAVFLPDVNTGPLNPGDTVRIKGQQNIGEILEVNEKEAVLMFGNMKMKAKLSSIERVKKSIANDQKGKVRVKAQFDINEKASNFNPLVEIIGMRADEALSTLRVYIDDALLLGAKQVKIMHGKGNGILREATRNWLKTLPEVHRFRDEHPDRGGAGATVVDFR